LKINLARLRGKKFFIATPMYGGVCNYNYTISMIKLVGMCHSYGIDFAFEFLYNESLITRGRNNLVRKFLNNKECDVLVFIDGDISFDPEDVLAMFYLAATDPDKGIVTAPYPKKTISWDLMYKAVQEGKINGPEDLKAHSAAFVSDFSSDNTRRDISLIEPQEIAEAGTGLMAISRNTFNAIMKRNPDKKYLTEEREETYDFFYVGIDKHNNRYISEDYSFCQEAHDVGVKTWILPWAQTAHFGSYLFEGNFGEYLNNIAT
jgi:hypothetical protein